MGVTEIVFLLNFLRLPCASRLADQAGWVLAIWVPTHLGGSTTVW